MDDSAKGGLTQSKELDSLHTKSFQTLEGSKYLFPTKKVLELDFKKYHMYKIATITTKW